MKFRALTHRGEIIFTHTTATIFPTLKQPTSAAVRTPTVVKVSFRQLFLFLSRK